MNLQWKVWTLFSLFVTVMAIVLTLLHTRRRQYTLISLLCPNKLTHSNKQDNQSVKQSRESNKQDIQSVKQSTESNKQDITCCILYERMQTHDYTCYHQRNQL